MRTIRMYMQSNLLFLLHFYLIIRMYVLGFLNIRYYSYSEQLVIKNIQIKFQVGRNSFRRRTDIYPGEVKSKIRFSPICTIYLLICRFALAGALHISPKHIGQRLLLASAVPYFRAIFESVRYRGSIGELARWFVHTLPGRESGYF